MISNQASRKGVVSGPRLGWWRRRRIASVPVSQAKGLFNLIGASAIALALCVSAPRGALAQGASPASEAAAAGTAAAASDAAAPGAAAAQNAPPAAPGASIRKTPGAALGGAPASAAKAAGAPASSDTTGAAPLAAPDTAGSDSAPAVIATPAAHVRAKARAKAKTKVKTGRHAHSASESASAKAGSKDTNADSNQDKNGKDKNKDKDEDTNNPFSSLQFAGNKGPVDIKSDALDLDYKGNVVTFRGHVHAVQADAVLTSDTLTVTYGKDFHEVKEMVANNNVRMSQGTRWATGDRAVLDQARHTVTLTGSPVVHDGEDQVAGTKITVHLDTGKSEVAGARAVFFPKDQKTRDNNTTVAQSP